MSDMQKTCTNTVYWDTIKNKQLRNKSKTLRGKAVT